MKRVLVPIAFFVLSLILWNCKDDDSPAPDLTSATISFLWDFTSSGKATFYAVISDTSGNVLKWDEIVPGTKLELPYPPNPNLATVTLIVRATGSSRATLLNTFTGIPAGDYTLKPTDLSRPEKDGEFKFGMVNPNEDFEFMYQYMSGNYEFIDISNDERDYTFKYGIYDDVVNNFFIWGSTDGLREVVKYKYFTDVNDGDSLGVSKDSFEDFEVMPYHDISYTQFPDVVSSTFNITGITSNDDGLNIDNRNFGPEETPKIAYADIADLFPQYQTLMNCFDFHGNTHYEKNTSKNPDLSFSNLTSTINKVYKVTTKRIALDLSGNGEIFYLEQRFGSDNDPVYYYIYAPLSSKVRMNLPEFPQELTDKITNLSGLKTEKSFDIGYVDEYNMSYSDFFNFFLSNDLFGYPPNMRSKGFAIDGGLARTSRGTNSFPKRLDKKLTSKIY